MSEHGQRLFIARADLAQAHLGPDPDAPAHRRLAPGQVRLAVEAFSLTANNITYAAFGEAMKYWQFFPAGERPGAQAPASCRHALPGQAGGAVRRCGYPPFRESRP